jgi:hypothetical protein
MPPTRMRSSQLPFQSWAWTLKLGANIGPNLLGGYE